MGVANQAVARPIGVVLMLVALFFVYRSFYGMRIAAQSAAGAKAAAPAAAIH
jgi:hypothetical protein